MAKPSRQTQAKERSARERAARDRGHESDDEVTEEVIEAMLNIFEKLGFSPEACRALVEDQQINSPDVLLEMNDDGVSDLCKVVRKPGGEGEGHQVAEISLQRLQLLVFYTKHLARTQQGFDLDNTSVKDINRLKEQKKLEKDWLKQNPEHKLEPMQLDAQRAAKCFDQATTILRRIRGVTGVPLSYVVRHRLVPDEDDGGDTPMGSRNSRFTSYDEEMEGRAPILHADADVGHPRFTFGPNKASFEEFEKDGPFHDAFLSDTRKAWSVLHALWSGSTAWHHVKTLDKTQNGRQVYRTLHQYFFGGSKVATLTTGILSSLRSFTYTGDSKNFNFEKYVTNHVEQHNLSASLIEYGGQALDESLKINYFLTGIQCSTFDAAKASIAANPTRFTDFDTVKDHFVDIRRMTQASKPAATSRVSAVTGRGGGRTGGAGRGNGQGRTSGREHARNKDPEARKAGLPSASEVAKCTHIEAKHYPKDEYDKFSKAEKQRHWQLMHPERKPGTDSKRKVSETRSSVSFKESEDSDDNKSLFSDDDAKDKKGGSNRDNSALKRPKK